jgi:hypothetical protein
MDGDLTLGAVIARQVLDKNRRRPGWRHTLAPFFHSLFGISERLQHFRSDIRLRRRCPSAFAAELLQTRTDRREIVSSARSGQVSSYRSVKL